MSINFDHMYAFAQGYYQGRVYGEYIDPPFEQDQERHLFKLGYESGVSDYCYFDEAQQPGSNLEEIKPL